MFALADLHLSLNGDKPMDRFGEIWINHPDRIRENWDRLVQAEDTVLLPGDLSWGRNLVDAEPDLAWIGERPGRKLLLRGNHDSWWVGQAKMARILPEGCTSLQNDSHEIGNWVVVGARGWTAPGDPYEKPGDDKVFARELERLRLSIADADRRFGRERPRLAMVHYPPLMEGRPETEVVPILRRAGVTVCVYGHLHGAEDHALAVRGLRDGIHYHFVACDAVGFSPVELDLP